MHSKDSITYDYLVAGDNETISSDISFDVENVDYRKESSNVKFNNNNYSSSEYLKDGEDTSVGLEDGDLSVKDVDVSPDPYDDGVGNGISTLDELQEVNNDLYSDYYLENDIDASDTRTWNELQKNIDYLNFDGDEDWVEVQDDDTLDQTSFTITSWVKPYGISDMSSSDNEFIIAKGTNYFISINGDGNLECIYLSGGTQYMYVSSSTLVDGNDYFISWSVSANDFSKIYIDGSLDKEDSITTTPDIDTYNVAVGYTPEAFQGSYDSINADLDDVRIFSSVISDSDVSNLSDVRYKELGDEVLHLKMNSGSGGVAYDDSGNDNDGVIYDASWDSKIIDPSNEDVYWDDDVEYDINDYVLVSTNYFYCIDSHLSSSQNKPSDSDYWRKTNLNAGDYLGFKPIGARNGNVSYFRGEFDGRGYEISNLYINRPDEDRVSFVGLVNGGGIKRVSLDNLNFTGEDYTGGVVGYLENSFLHNVSSSGVIISNDGLGGLVGWVYTNSYLENSYSHVNVSGNRYVGGAVGYFSGSGLSYIYSTGRVSGNLEYGGFSGYGDCDNNYSYWNTETSNMSTSTCGIGKNTSEMTNYSDYPDAYEGWKFNDIWISTDWKTDQVGNSGYPALTFEESRISFTVSYDSTSFGWSFGSRTIYAFLIPFTIVVVLVFFIMLAMKVVHR